MPADAKAVGPCGERSWSEADHPGSLLDGQGLSGALEPQNGQPVGIEGREGIHELRHADALARWRQQGRHQGAYGLDRAKGFGDALGATDLVGLALGFGLGSSVAPRGGDAGAERGETGIYGGGKGMGEGLGLFGV